MKKEDLKEMFPSWASPEAIIEVLCKEYEMDSIMESDIYYNSSGDVVITMDMEHITIFPDDERPGLYSVARARTFDSTTTYSDANGGMKKFHA